MMSLRLRLLHNYEQLPRDKNKRTQKNSLAITGCESRRPICGRHGWNSATFARFVNSDGPACEGPKITGDESPVVRNGDPAVGSNAAGAIFTGTTPAATGMAGNRSTIGNLPTGAGKIAVFAGSTMDYRPSETMASSSSGSLGMASDSTRQPSSVTSTSSSMRMPMPL